MTPLARRLVVRLLLGPAMLVGMTSSAQAQMPVPGGTGVTGMPSPAVFGGARRQDPETNNVSLSASALGGYDTNILADDAFLGGGTGGQLGSVDQTASTFAGGSAQLVWNQNRTRVSYFGNVGVGYRTFFDISDFDVQSYDAGGGMSAQVTARSSVLLNANVGIQPFYQFGVLGGGFAVGQPAFAADGGSSFVPDFMAAREQVLRFGGSASYVYQLSPRTTFSADVSRFGFRPLNDEAEQSGFVNLGSTFAGARLTRRLTTDLGARVGYGYSWFDTVDTRPLLPGEVGQESIGMHNIDVGLDYAKALTFARRTSFSFGTGTSIWRSTGGVNGVNSGQTQYNVNGFATLQRQFLRTWGASLNYTRGTSYVEGFNEFVVFDAASASLAGLFTDRLDAGAGLFYTNGGFQSIGGERVASVGAGGQLRYGFTQSLAAFVSYTYTRFDIPEELQPQGLIETYRPDRQGIRFGLTVWFDLLR